PTAREARRRTGRSQSNSKAQRPPSMRRSPTSPGFRATTIVAIRPARTEPSRYGGTPRLAHDPVRAIRERDRVPRTSPVEADRLERCVVRAADERRRAQSESGEPTPGTLRERRRRELPLQGLELAQQRAVLALEEVVRHPGALEHREGVGARSGAKRKYPRREERELVLSGAGEHVDHAGGGLGFDPEEELAEPVHDLVLAVDQLELARELRRPARKVVDVGEV